MTLSTAQAEYTYNAKLIFIYLPLTSFLNRHEHKVISLRNYNDLVDVLNTAVSTNAFNSHLDAVP